MEILLVVLVVAAFIFGLWCMKREKSLAGFYKQIGVCGRVSSFFTGYLAICTVVALVFFVIGIVQAIGGKGNIGSAFGMLLGAVLFGGIAFLLFTRAYKRCPEDLKKRFPWDLLVIAWGVTCRLSLFILMFILKAYWELNKPRAYMVDGQVVYAYPFDDGLYNSLGMRVGTISDDCTEAIME